MGEIAPKALSNEIGMAFRRARVDSLQAICVAVSWRPPICIDPSSTVRITDHDGACRQESPDGVGILDGNTIRAKSAGGGGA